MKEECRYHPITKIHSLNVSRTNETSFAMTVLSRRFLEMNQVIYACFINFQEAVDKVQISVNMKLEITNSTWDYKLKLQSTTWDSNNMEHLLIPKRECKGREWMNWKKLKFVNRSRGQGCVLSTLLLNINSEAICQLSLRKQRKTLWKRWEN